MVLFLCAGLVASGCCAERFARPAELLSEPEQLAQRMHTRAQRVRSLEYLTRMSYYGEQGARKGRVEILAQRPKQVRFEAMSPTDDTLAFLASDGERFASHERGQARCLVGEACAANISRLLPVRLEGEELFEVLIGAGVPLHYDEATLQWNDCEGVYELTVAQGEDASRLVQTVWVRPDTFAAIRVRRTRGGEPLFQLDFDNFQTVDGISIPMTLSLVAEQGDTDVRIEVREAYLNQVDSAVPFQPTCPTGTNPEELPCQ